MKNCLSAKPKFSSSYWGKQCFRFPSLSTYRFWVVWKQSKHARKKIGAWKFVFLQSPISSHKTIRGHPTKKMNRNGELQTSRISSNLRIWQSYSRAPQILKVLCAWYSWKYVARLGFEPLKFLYSAVRIQYSSCNYNVLVNGISTFWILVGMPKGEHVRPAELQTVYDSQTVGYLGCGIGLPLCWERGSHAAISAKGGKPWSTLRTSCFPKHLYLKWSGEHAAPKFQCIPAPRWRQVNERHEDELAELARNLRWSLEAIKMLHGSGGVLQNSTNQMVIGIAFSQCLGVAFKTWISGSFYQGSCPRLSQAQAEGSVAKRGAAEGIIPLLEWIMVMQLNHKPLQVKNWLLWCPTGFRWDDPPGANTCGGRLVWCFLGGPRLHQKTQERFLKGTLFSPCFCHTHQPTIIYLPRIPHKNQPPFFHGGC